MASPFIGPGRFFVVCWRLGMNEWESTSPNKSSASRERKRPEYCFQRQYSGRLRSRLAKSKENDGGLPRLACLSLTPSSRRPARLERLPGLVETEFNLLGSTPNRCSLFFIA